MEFMRFLLVILVLLLLNVLLVCASSSSSSSSSNITKVGAIFSFGDSIFDAGTNGFIKNCTTQADFPPYGSSFFHHPTGRFTNGRTLPDFFSEFIGIDMQKPYLEAQAAVMNGSMKDYPSNGVNFASAGSGLLPSTDKENGVISIQEQLQQFQDLVNQSQITKNLINNSLFLLESGSNDIFNYFIPTHDPKPDPQHYVESMLAEAEKFLTQIYNIGGRRIAVLSLGPLGCVPARAMLVGVGAPIGTCYGKMNKMVKQYNVGLENLIHNVSNKYNGLIGVYGELYQIVQHYRTFPKRFGFSDVSNACCGDGVLGGMLQCGKEGFKICKNPNQFLFWDYFHPSEHTNHLLSNALWLGGKLQIRPFNLKTLANFH
ncbi:GDSL esterase/lipase 6 [Senna tora]|uniref:GDSL esterase/lipase 6 n=1 Tax=Senna tora TaxID=362788 RepID=A0A834STA1_9FABA|nr:GDSL esterase/lipase 6 [Senna tora]